MSRLALIVLACSGGLCAAEAATRPYVSQQEALAIVRSAARSEGFDFAKVGMDIEVLDRGHGRTIIPGYYEFSLSYENEQAGATQALRLYAVSFRTGDIWEVNVCHRYQTQQLARQQAAIRARTRFQLSDEQDFRKGLGCDGDHPLP